MATEECVAIVGGCEAGKWLQLNCVSLDKCIN